MQIPLLPHHPHCLFLLKFLNEVQNHSFRFSISSIIVCSLIKSWGFFLVYAWGFLMFLFVCSVIGAIWWFSVSFFSCFVCLCLCLCCFRGHLKGYFFHNCIIGFVFLIFFPMTIYYLVTSICKTVLKA